MRAGHAGERNLSSKLRAVEAAFSAAAERGLVHLIAEDAELDGRHVTLAGRRVRNFGSCSYVGLETDQRLRSAACDAVSRFGVQFASSRAYLSSPLYAELEALIAQICGASIVLAQTTTLAHMAVLPVLVEAGDAVLVDQFVHASVQAVLPQLREEGAMCRFVRHNRVDRLDRHVQSLVRRHRRVFYLADGVYSMSGALAPVGELRQLLERYEQLHVYIDDAHGMSWQGRRGAGTVLDGGMHERMVVALSLAKAFSAGGAVLAFPRDAQARLVRTCGSTMIFSGPLQPALLGAAVASAKVHLSSELSDRQAALAERIRLFNQLCQSRGVPLASMDATPIRFVAIGSEERAYDVAVALLRAGYYTNAAAYPAVPKSHAGIRIALTVHHTLEDVRALVELIAASLPPGVS